MAMTMGLGSWPKSQRRGLNDSLRMEGREKKGGKKTFFFGKGLGDNGGVAWRASSKPGGGVE